MRTNIHIDDEPVARAMQAGGLPTRRETVEARLRLLFKLTAQERVEAIGASGAGKAISTGCDAVQDRDPMENHLGSRVLRW